MLKDIILRTKSLFHSTLYVSSIQKVCKLMIDSVNKPTDRWCRPMILPQPANFRAQVQGDQLYWTRIAEQVCVRRRRETGIRIAIALVARATTTKGINFH